MPANPKIYHITHIGNFDNILSDGVVWSDAKRLKHGIHCEVVGMLEIKRRRLEELEVRCHSGTMVGQYVPFYFCPRSIMLYLVTISKPFNCEFSMLKTGSYTGFEIVSYYIWGIIRTLVIMVDKVQLCTCRPI